LQQKYEKSLGYGQKNTKSDFLLQKYRQKELILHPNYENNDIKTHSNRREIPDADGTDFFPS
jgi:hypothetical protein